MLEEFNIPIFKKAYDLYKLCNSYRGGISKQDRYGLWLRTENTLLDIVEGILKASHLSKREKLPTLEMVNLKVNLLRVFVRLAKDTKTVDNEKYIAMQQLIDEIGRMLGGWIKSTKER